MFSSSPISFIALLFQEICYNILYTPRLWCVSFPTDTNIVQSVKMGTWGVVQPLAYQSDWGTTKLELYPALSEIMEILVATQERLRLLRVFA